MVLGDLPAGMVAQQTERNKAATLVANKNRLIY
jgi:hypothetical protein